MGQEGRNFRIGGLTQKMIHTKGKTFTIERSKWLRGEGSKNSSLLRSCDGKMCCLGQVMQQCGIPDNELREIGEPSDIHNPDIEVEVLCEWQQWAISPTRHMHPRISSMMELNDDVFTEDFDRESRLSELAQQAGFSLKFVD